MGDIRSRLAALRARRQQREAAKVEAAKPKCEDAALAAAAAAVGEPQQTWDEDFRERLAGRVEESDEEMDEIVVLPPVAVKLDPIAARVAWRKKQMMAAKLKARENIRELFPEPVFIHKVAEKKDTTIVDDVNDEEDLLLEQSEEDSDVEGSEVRDGDGADVEEGVESSGNDGGGEAGGSIVHASTFAERCVVEILEEMIKKACISSNVNAGTYSERTVTTCLKLTKTLQETQVRCETEETEVQQGVETLVDPALTEDSSRLTAQLATESTSTIRSVAKTGEMSTSRKGKFSTVTSGALGAFAKLLKRGGGGSATVSSVRDSTVQTTGGCELIDDEAEMENEADGEIPIAIDSDADEEAELLINDGVVADSETPVDVEKLAKFHRQWEREANARSYIHGESGKAVDVDNAMDLSELMKREKERGDDDAASFCAGGGAEEDKEGEETFDAMFRDENGGMEMQKELEGSPEDRKQQARALWKARQQQRERNGMGDANAISLLDAFKDSDDEDVTAQRSAELRAQLEQATKRPSVRAEKRRQAEETPEWKRRRVAHLRKRRRTAVSMQKWSYASEELDRVDEAVENGGKSRKGAVGGSIYKPKAISVTEVRRSNNGSTLVRKKRAGRRPKSLLSLLETLGERPTTDVA